MSSKIKLNEEQKEAFKIIRKFLNSGADTLVLKGYAGTGKTFLMQIVGKWLTKRQRQFSLLASTGRAAAVLRGKTGLETRTVHSELYHFMKVDDNEEDIPENAPMEQYGQMTLQFGIRPPDRAEIIYIIDEASMLSSIVTNDRTIIAFGLNNLMADLFDVVGLNKLIFVGDPCQLPPIGQTISPALDLDWLAQHKRTAITFTLNKIERTDHGNDILVLADLVRKRLQETEWENFPKIPARNLNNVSLHISDQELFQMYLAKHKEVGIYGALAIARTNRTVQHINRAIRRDLYGTLDLPLQINEILLVTQNNYAVPLTNGDFVIVTHIGESRFQANLKFLSVRVKAILSETDYEILLSVDLLNNSAINFNGAQQKALMIEFSKRMRRSKIKPNSDTYKSELKKDPFLNCLKAKYGYGVTCHKAQGGEWDHVYLFLDQQMYGMQKPELFRWWYTAITRTRKQLHLTDKWWIG